MINAFFVLMVFPAPILLSYEFYLQINSAYPDYSALAVAGLVVAALCAPATLLLLRQYNRPLVRLLFLSGQAIAIALIGPLVHPDYWSAPPLTSSMSVAGSDLIGPLLFHSCLAALPTWGNQQQRRKILAIIYGGALAAIAFGLSHTTWGLGVSVAFAVAALGAALCVTGYAYHHRVSPDGRRRLRVAFFSVLLTIIPAVPFYILPPVFGLPPLLPSWAAYLFLILGPIGSVAAVLHQNLLGIDRLINRAMVYAILSAGVLALFLIPMLLITSYFSGDVFAESIVVLLVISLMGLSFGWTQRGVQYWVDRLFYGGWYDYPGVVESISAALARSLDREILRDVLTRQVASQMRLMHAKLWIGEVKEPLSDQYCYDFQADIPARWVIGPRNDGDALSVSDLRILRTLSRQAEMALTNVLLVEKLRQKLDEISASHDALIQAQHRLLRSREEERGRLARDLHDGPIQELVGLNIQIGMLLSSSNAGSPNGSLKEMRDEVKNLLGELRQICADLRPPMLDSLGLGPALHVLGDEWSAQSGVKLEWNLITDAALRQLSPDVSVNLYRIAQEALANIARHAHAQRAAFALVREADSLCMSIGDDGQGFNMPSDYHTLASTGHYGLAGMEERAALIGGKLEIETAPGKGTLIRISIKNSNFLKS